MTARMATVVPGAALWPFLVIFRGENSCLELLHLQREEGEPPAVKGESWPIGVDRGRQRKEINRTLFNHIHKFVYHIHNFI